MLMTSVASASGEWIVAGIGHTSFMGHGACYVANVGSATWVEVDYGDTATGWLETRQIQNPQNNTTYRTNNDYVVLSGHTYYTLCTLWVWNGYNFVIGDDDTFQWTSP
jgi:hypothetical protein